MIFKDKYFFLSTFYPCEIELTVKDKKLIYKNVEAAFQASKNSDLAEKFLLLSGLEAKKFGANIPITTPNWDITQLYVMAQLLNNKFRNFGLLFQLKTLQEPIVNDNFWYDTFWGKYKGEGKDILGRMLTCIKETNNDLNSLIAFVDKEVLSLCIKED